MGDAAAEVLLETRDALPILRLRPVQRGVVEERLEPLVLRARDIEALIDGPAQSPTGDDRRA